MLGFLRREDPGPWSPPLQAALKSNYIPRIAVLHADAPREKMKYILTILYRDRITSCIQCPLSPLKQMTFSKRGKHNLASLTTTADTILFSNIRYSRRSLRAVKIVWLMPCCFARVTYVDNLSFHATHASFWDVSRRHGYLCALSGFRESSKYTTRNSCAAQSILLIAPHQSPKGTRLPFFVTIPG